MRALHLAALCLLGACASSRDEPSGGVREAGSGTAPHALEPAATATSSGAGSPQVPAARPASAGDPSAPAEVPGDRIYAKGRFVWIVKGPGSKGWLGYLTLGGSVRLKDGSKERALTAGAGCDAWYAVEPRGYVCLGPETTLDPNDPQLVALQGHAGKVDPFPFEYGESLGTPRYFELPSVEKQRQSELDLVEHLSKTQAAPAGVPFPALPALPSIVRENRVKVIPGSTVAWSKAYDDPSGRTWLYTSDHALVPKDRVKPYPRSTFQGVALGGETQLPIAFFRKKDRPKQVKEGGAFVEKGSFTRLSWVQLSGKEERVGKERLLETKEPGVWVKESDAAVARKAETIPFLADEQPAGRRTWLDVSVLGGTLVAYEAERPVFATLIAPGRGGTPFPGRDPVSTASTPTGTFRVDGKFRWATMVSSSDSNIVHSEVQWVQNFHGPHALHGAYWHDAWGELMSGGCVNLSPIDSKWVFEFTEPALPKDWHGVRSIPEFGPATRVVVRP